MLGFRVLGFRVLDGREGGREAEGERWTERRRTCFLHSFDGPHPQPGAIYAARRSMI